ncbi:MAG: (2Fe-2S)-binding protein [Acidobacteria bacterium]|nr:(2Fe-2S)-binding protein [Acidobacteriota bacterium]
MVQRLKLEVNGSTREVGSDPNRPLLDVLREDLELTGTKFGCGEGQCRACTVLLDGAPTPSCLTPISAVQGKRITTIEGLEAAAGALHPVQQAFLDEGALQCGYCTSGMILTAAALLERTPEPTEAQIVDGMNNNLCRCCGYPRILAAVRRAASVRT